MYIVNINNHIINMMKKNLHHYVLFLLSFISILIETEARCHDNVCEDNPKPCCYTWPMSIMERKMLSPFCFNGQICYIWDDMAYPFTKCHGYCHASKTLPGHYANGVWTKCKDDECRCCRPKIIQKMKVCAVCCLHPICQRRFVRHGATPPPGSLPIPTGSNIPSKAEVERLAKVQLASRGGVSPLSPLSFWAVWRPRTTGPPTPPRPPTRPPQPPTRPRPPTTPQTPFRTTTVPPPKRIVPDGCPGCCPPWTIITEFDVPRDCDCQACV